MKTFNFKTLNEEEGKENCDVEVSNRFAILEDFDAEVEISTVWKSIRGIIKISAIENPSYY
jgi:hypothetical protein